MTTDSALREQICTLAKSMFDRGLTGGCTGNVSAKTSDGGLLVSPTGTSFGRLGPARLSQFDSASTLISGDRPTKEMPLHSAFYETREATGAVVHIHSCHSVALSLMPDANTENFLPPITTYSVMKLGKVKLLPFFRSGDPRLGEALRDLGGVQSAVMLANHEPVVAGQTISSACDAIEELEASARLALLTRRISISMLNDSQINDLVTHFDLKCDE